MIYFDILLSPDSNVRNNFKFMSNTLFIGRKNGDLIIADPDLKESHLMIEVIGKDLLVHLQRDVDFFLINGKRATSVRKIRAADEITIGKTVIKIVTFEETIIYSKKNILTEKLDQLVEKNSIRLPVIETLSKMSK